MPQPYLNYVIKTYGITWRDCNMVYKPYYIKHATELCLVTFSPELYNIFLVIIPLNYITW